MQTPEELKYTKLYNYVRGWMEAKKFYTTVKALDFARTRHVGTRKDNVTPEFSHQLHMARFFMNLEPLVLNPARCITLIFLHDTVEDHSATLVEVVNEFGFDIGLGVRKLSKVIHEIKLSNAIYYSVLLEDVDACLVKGVDRLHNLESMAGAFTTAKKQAYVEETEEYALPLLKQARNRYPDHANIFNHLRHVMIIYTKLVREELKVAVQA
jgi:(p)ppGpp synthase/HD superfamily hydrolase